MRLTKQFRKILTAGASSVVSSTGAGAGGSTGVVSPASGIDKSDF